MGDEFVKQVVEDVSELLNKRVPLNVGEYVIGVQQVVKQIKQAPWKKHAQVLGLWGTGGIGKSTLAREL